jgi:protein transport protein SEC61 subunit gamma-like protein
MDEFQQEKPSVFSKLKGFIEESKRVLIITKKPSKEEFKTIVKASGLGILIIGFIGFVVAMIQQIFFR